ncbi:hypothetical protein OROHE_023000 [Orobanche hederae]
MNVLLHGEDKSPPIETSDKGTGGEVLNDEENFVVVKNLPGDTSMKQVREHFKVAGYPTRIVL